MPTAYVSLPLYNEVQEEGGNRIKQVLTAAGLELRTIFDSEADNIGEVCADAVKGMVDSDLVVLWMDFLYEKGLGVYHLYDLRTELEVPLPPAELEMLQVGAQALAQAGKNPQIANKLILTQEELAAPIEIPSSLKLDFQSQGYIAGKLGGKALNIPDPTVMFEYGFASALGKPTIVVALAKPIVGSYGDTSCDVLVNSLENLSTVVDRWKADYDPEREANPFTEEALEELRPVDASFSE